MPPTDPETTRWFAEQVLPHEAALRAFLHSLVPPSDIDDLMQETFTRVLRARAQGEIASVRGLLFATARNAARDLFRRRAVAPLFPIAEMDAVRVYDSAPDLHQCRHARDRQFHGRGQWLLL